MINRLSLSFHHLGLAAREPSRAHAFLEALGYRINKFVFDPEQNVNLAMAFHSEMPAVEIIWSTGSAGPLDRMLEKYAKGVVYHVCYVTEDLKTTLDAFANAELDPFCVSSPKPAVLFGGKLVSFYAIKGIGLIEIIEGMPA